MAVLQMAIIMLGATCVLSTLQALWSAPMHMAAMVSPLAVLELSQEGSSPAAESTINSSSMHLAGELYSREFGAKMVHVPFSNPGNATTNLISGELQLMFQLVPGIASQGRIGWLSGFAWGLGYVGGLIALFIVLAGTFYPVLFGLDAASHELERLTGPASAIWLAVFVLPMFLFTPDPGAAMTRPLPQAARQGVTSLFSTLRALRQHRNLLTFLIAFMLYNDGLAAIIAFGGVYASATFGWTTVTLGIFGIILTTFAIPGAFLGGRLDDLLGSRRMVQIATAGVIVASLGIVSVTADRVLFFLPAGPLAADRAMFGSMQEQVFMAFALLLGACMGPMQAASRTMVGRLAPPGMAGEFYGLFALSGRATAWLAPLAIGIITATTQSNRLGVACVLVFLVVGFCLLWFVREG